MAAVDTPPALQSALLLLTASTGVIDAVSFLGLGHIFTANMTGNIVFLGFAVAGAPSLSIARSLASLGSFLLGAIAGGHLAHRLAERARRRWLLLSALLEALLLAAAALAALFLADPLYTVIFTTALAMGLRNATARRLAAPDLTTTVLTLTLTGLAAESSPAGGANPRAGRRLAAVAAMFLGAASGVFLLRYGLAAPLAVCVLLALATAFCYRSIPTAE